MASQKPQPGTFAARRAERLEREQRHGVQARRRFGLVAGQHAENDFTFTERNDQDPGSPA
jgi:hypothetical protein